MTRTAGARSATRHHPLLVALHWILALMILAMLAVGVRLALTPNAEPGKIAVLKWHMGAGMLVLVLMVIRYGVRLVTARPPPLATGQPRLDRLARPTHLTFYLLVVAMVVTGYVTGLLARLPAIVWAGSGEPLPDFAAYPTFTAHAVLAALLTALIAVHLAAVVHHQVVRKRRLFGRMLWGPRTVNPPPPQPLESALENGQNP